MMLRKPTCSDCPHNLQYMESLPIKKKGVTMHLGECFCVAGKRARKFKRSDPKTYVPSWCPRLKAPCELRIYGLKNQREWRMHRSMCAYLGEDTVSANSGGIAVSGTCSLYGMWEDRGIAVWIEQRLCADGKVFCYRTIRSSRDFKGGYNHFLTSSDLKTWSYPQLLETLSALRKDGCRYERAA